MKRNRNLESNQLFLIVSKELIILVTDRNKWVFHVIISLKKPSTKNHRLKTIIYDFLLTKPGIGNADSA